MRFLVALVATPLALAQVFNPQPGNLSIGGMVSDQLSGAPLAGARIVLDMNRPGRTLAYSDAAGHFQFGELPAGPHNLLASRTGYVQTSQLVVLAPGRNSTGVRLSLAPQAVIAGTVEDQDGFPVSSASIIFLARSAQGELVSASQGGITSDDRGRFRAAGLAGGHYYLHAEPGMARNWDARYAAVYYPAALKFEDAEAIEAASGQERAGIVVRLVLSGGVRVQGRVDLPPGAAVQQSNGRAQVGLATIGMPGFGRVTTVLLADDGTFALNNVQPGKYRLEASLPPPYSRGFTTGPAGALEPNLEVGSSDITGIVLKVEDSRPLDLPGKVVFEAGTRAAPVFVFLAQRNSVQARTTSQEDGAFVLRGVRPGKYRLDAAIQGEGARGVSARLGEADLPYGSLEVKGPHPGSLVITMSSAVARVEGVIVDAAGHPLSGKFALFRAVKPGLQPVAVGTSEADGRFWAEMPPGQYRVWLAASVPAGFRDGPADVPPGQGQLVTFVEGDNPPLQLAMPAAK